MKFLSILSTVTTDVVKYAPLALASVLTVEQSLKTSPGETKRQVAVNMVGNLAKVAEGSGNVTAEAIGGLVDMLVQILNATGTFQHAPQDPAPPAPAMTDPPADPQAEAAHA